MNRAAALLVAAMLCGGWSAPGSVHEQLLAQHADSPTFGADAVVPVAPWQLAAVAERGEGGPTVMGYLPYWVEVANIPWESVDIVAWFGVPMGADGTLGNDHGWGDEGAQALIDEAHAVGARVVLSTTRFGGSAVHDLLDSPSARSMAIDNLVDAMLDGGGDGIDIDFEGLRSEDRDAMIAFVQELRTDLDAAQPGSLLTMATPAIDWGGAWDYDVLAESADVLFIMGYGFHGSWSDPGPLAPLDGGSPWSSRSLRWSVQDYVEWGGAYNAHKVVLGLPLYGYQWVVEGPEVPGESLGEANSVFWDTARERASLHGWDWDEVTATPWSSWVGDDGEWRQLWFEDPESIRLKAEMARDEGIGGFGFFSLNYDEGDDELWSAVSDVVSSWDGDDPVDPGDDDDSTEPELDDDDSADEEVVDEGADDDLIDRPVNADAFDDVVPGDACACSSAPPPPFALSALALLLGLAALRRRLR